MRVLLVDDEQELVSAMAERLSLRDIDADWAAAPQDALDMAAENEYDIIVLDVKLPGMSGIDLRKKLDEAAGGRKYIYLTGQGSDEEYEVCTAEEGTCAYLVKPVNIEDLVKLMKEALETGEA